MVGDSKIEMFVILGKKQRAFYLFRVCVLSLWVAAKGAGVAEGECQEPKLGLNNNQALHDLSLATPLTI